jgi:hypothetical protein
MTVHTQHDRDNLATIKACLKKFGRNTDAESYHSASYVYNAARQVIKNNSGKKNLTQQQSTSLETLKKRTPKKPRKAPKKIVL